MNLCKQQLLKLKQAGRIPIGSVLVKAGEIIARGHNKRVQNSDSVNHAEIDCLRNAFITNNLELWNEDIGE